MVSTRSCGKVNVYFLCVNISDIFSTQQRVLHLETVHLTLLTTFNVIIWNLFIGEILAFWILLAHWACYWAYLMTSKQTQDCVSLTFIKWSYLFGAINVVARLWSVFFKQYGSTCVYTFKWIFHHHIWRSWFLMKPYSEAQVGWDYTKNEKQVDRPQQWCVMCISTHHTTRQIATCFIIHNCIWVEMDAVLGIGHSSNVWYSKTVCSEVTVR